MKKQLSLLLSFILVLSFMIPAFATIDDKKGKPLMLCDVDGDGKITAGDARFLLRASVGLQEIYDPFVFEIFDVDFDGKISASDARLALRTSVGLEEAFPYFEVRAKIVSEGAVNKALPQKTAAKFLEIINSYENTYGVARINNINNSLYFLSGVVFTKLADLDRDGLLDLIIAWTEDSSLPWGGFNGNTRMTICFGKDYGREYAFGTFCVTNFGNSENAGLYFSNVGGTRYYVQDAGYTTIVYRVNSIGFLQMDYFIDYDENGILYSFGELLTEEQKQSTLGFFNELNKNGKSYHFVSQNKAELDKILEENLNSVLYITDYATARYAEVSCPVCVGALGETYVCKNCGYDCGSCRVCGSVFGGRGSDFGLCEDCMDNYSDSGLNTTG